MANQLVSAVPETDTCVEVIKAEGEVVNAATRRFRLGHRPYLDGLRGVAVLLIIVHHARLVTPLGVDIFFVLSGFLITALLLQEWDQCGKIHLRRFYARRALRLLPALVLLLAAVCLHAYLFQGIAALKATALAALAALGYVSNWMEAFDLLRMGILYHTWSLSVEEQFYICWPLAAIVLLHFHLRARVVVALLGTAAIVIALHRTHLAFGDAPGNRIYVALDTRGDALLLGCMLGFMEARQLLPRRRLAQALFGVVGLISVAGLVLLLGWQGGSEVLALPATLAPLAAAGLLLWLLGGAPWPILSMLEAQPLVWTGKISYGLYLWNFPVCYILTRPSWSHPLAASLQVAATFTMAAASFYLWEQPFLHLKKRFAAD